MKRTAFFLGLGLMLFACAPTPSPVTSFNLFGDQTTRLPSPRFTELSNNNAPMMQVGIEAHEVTSIVRRDMVRGTFSTWISREGASLTLDRGILVATRGFGGDMMGSDVAATAALVLGMRTGHAPRFHSFLTGNDQYERRSYACSVTTRGVRTLRIGQSDLSTRLMQQDCENPDQAFSNLYWVSVTSGEIVQSRQWAGVFTGPLALRMVPD